MSSLNQSRQIEYPVTITNKISMAVASATAFFKITLEERKKEYKIVYMVFGG